MRADFWCGNLKAIAHLEDLDLDDSVICDWI